MKKEKSKTRKKSKKELDESNIDDIKTSALDQQFPRPLIRAYVEAFYGFQKTRIEVGLRSTATQKIYEFSDEQMKEYGFNMLFSNAKIFENQIESVMKQAMLHEPLYTGWLTKIHGIGNGAILAAGIIGLIEDISRFDHDSQLCQYAGLGMNTYCEKCKKPGYIEVEYTDKDKNKKKRKKLHPVVTCSICGSKTVPQRQKKTIGYSVNWNPKLRVHMWKLGESFKKQGKKSCYYNIYLQEKEKIAKDHPDYPPWKIDKQALVKLKRIFLCHVWKKWRQIEGLPVHDTYAKSHLGHEDIIEPCQDKP